MKRPLSRLRLTPRGRLRRNVVLLLLLPLALLLVLRPCFTHQAALERLQSRFHFGPVDAAQWYPEEAIYALRYDRWYAVCSLERQPFFLGHTWRPDARGLIAAPVEDAPLSVCGIHYDLFFGLCSDPAIESVRITCTGDGGPIRRRSLPTAAGCFSGVPRSGFQLTRSTPLRPWTARGRCSIRWSVPWLTNTISSDLNSTAYSSSIWYAIPKGGYAMRQLIPALLLLTLLLPAAAAAQSPVTRVQFVAALWTCSGAVPYDANGPFSDVNPNSPGATAVAWAYDLGIVRGTGGTLFVPDRPITREEAAVLLRRYAVHLGRDTFLPSGVAACNDFEGISPWADDSLYWAAGIGLLAWGADGRPEPQGTLSPEELEQALARFFDRPVPAIPYLLEHW